MFGATSVEVIETFMESVWENTANGSIKTIIIVFFICVIFLVIIYRVKFANKLGSLSTHILKKQYVCRVVHLLKYRIFEKPQYRLIKNEIPLYGIFYAKFLKYNLPKTQCLSVNLFAQFLSYIYIFKQEDYDLKIF